MQRNQLDRMEVQSLRNIYYNNAHSGVKTLQELSLEDEIKAQNHIKEQEFKSKYLDALIENKRQKNMATLRNWKLESQTERKT